MEDSDGGREGGMGEGMGTKRGRVLAICPVVRAPSGQGGEAAPWLTKHTHTPVQRARTMHVTRVHTYALVSVCTGDMIWVFL